MCDIRLKPVSGMILCCLLMALFGLSQPAVAAKKSASEITPSELQSQIMSFADRFVARVSGATNDYVYLKGYAKTPFLRTAVQGRKLGVSSAAVSIAAGSNPEVSLLDMVVMTSLLKLRTEDLWVGRKMVPHSDLLLEAYIDLEKDIWAIARSVLSKEQASELRELINEWHKKNINKIISIASVRFGDFAKQRRHSSLVKDGKASGFLKSVQEANKEIEQTRVLAERTIFLVERQPTLMRWQVEQTFFELAMEPEFSKAINSLGDVSQAADRISKTVEQMPALISSERKAAIEQALQGVSKERIGAIKQVVAEFSKERNVTIEQAFQSISKERVDAITQAVTGFSKERQALINQTSERILEKAFFMGVLLIIFLLLGAVVSRLIYKFLEIRFFEKKPNSPSPAPISKA